MPGFAAGDAADDAAVGKVLEVGGLDAARPAVGCVEVVQPGPLDPIRCRQQSGEHQEAADHADIGRLRRRAQRVGEGRRRREVEHLQDGVGLASRNTRLPVWANCHCALDGQRRIGRPALRDVGPGEVRVVEPVEPGRRPGEGHDRAVRFQRIERASAGRRQARRCRRKTMETAHSRRRAESR